MQHTIKSLTGYQIGATDGDIGELKEFYFDDETWAVRYLIIETGNWLTGRKILLSPQAIVMTDTVKEVFLVNLSKEQISRSPDVDTDQPVSHRLEIQLSHHYSWQRYSGGGFYAGGSPGLLNMAPLPDETDTPTIDDNSNNSEFDPHLRSTERITDYHIHATNEDIGHVKDFIIDDQKWTITDLVIDTHNWLGGNKVLLPVRHVKNIDWKNFKVITDVSADFIKDCSSFEVAKLNLPVMDE
ncbi:MAG TPA: PRC-barrel domain-containing protein [Chitinophagaceae bacterium]|jgi:sporulation protein YlmC with PRC-barrel domain|nr:PRC-barrel domain-containing protein [Chitinophagaceae bacterium]